MDDRIKKIAAGIEGLEERTKNSDCCTEFRNGQNRAYVLVKELIYQQFPELKESEDERIRKWIVNYIHHGAFNEEEHPMALKAIEWLEKQKEQKPAEWSEEDERIANEILDHFNTGNAEWFNWFNARFKSLRPQPKLNEEEIKKIRSEEYTKGFNDAAFGGKIKEWCMEDEDRIRQIERIAQAAGCTQKLQEEIYDWLKSLRPQPKVEWSEEDEAKKERLISIVKRALHGNEYPILNDNGATELITWLKSLRPQPHWKPSKEQMWIFKDTKLRMKLSGYKFGDVLDSLYNDLKKL